jgi:hypothetical protein
MTAICFCLHTETADAIGWTRGTCYPKKGSGAMLASPIPRDLRVYIDQVTGREVEFPRGL